MKHFPTLSHQCCINLLTISFCSLFLSGIGLLLLASSIPPLFLTGRLGVSLCNRLGVYLVLDLVLVHWNLLAWSFWPITHPWSCPIICFPLCMSLLSLLLTDQQRHAFLSSSKWPISWMNKHSYATVITVSQQSSWMLICYWFWHWTVQIGLLNGKVGAITSDGHSFITSSNQDYIPSPPLSHCQVRLHSDMCYTGDDPTLWPQSFIPYFSHYGAIPTPYSLSKHPAIWWISTCDHFSCHAHLHPLSMV